jgi:arabinofuranosyltransferase
VYNSGERVEGYTNFLWTMIVALGMKPGIDPVPLSITLGISFYALTLGLYAVLSWKLNAGRAMPGIVIPLAALALCLHRDFNVYATSGLETSMFTFLVSLGFALLLFVTTARGLFVTGVVFALTLMTRPDGAVFLGAAMAYMLLARRDRLRSAAWLLLPLVLVYAPYWLWRYSYYGYLFPNPFYAKSIGLSYYSQGAEYIWMYFKTYYAIPVVLYVVVTVLWNKRDASTTLRVLFAAVRDPGAQPPEVRAVVLGALYIAVWLLFIVRIGGDFMFARFLIPVTPVVLFLIEALVVSLPSRKAVIVACVALAAGIFFRYDLYDRTNLVGLVADEWQYYPRKFVEESRVHGERLNRYFKASPVKVGFGGRQAQLIYYADPVLAIECETGLTDTTIAHLPITKRWRPGHEKQAPTEYLVRRKVNLLLWEREKDAPSRFISNMFVDSITIPILVYENAVMDKLSGFADLKFFNVPEGIDEYIDSINTFTPDRVREDYDFLKTYYFDHNSDSVRQGFFIDYLSGGRPAGGG